MKWPWVSRTQFDDCFRALENANSKVRDAQEREQNLLHEQREWNIKQEQRISLVISDKIDAEDRLAVVLDSRDQIRNELVSTKMQRDQAISEMKYQQERAGRLFAQYTASREACESMEKEIRLLKSKKTTSKAPVRKKRAVKK